MNTAQTITPPTSTLTDQFAFLVSTICSPFLILPALILGATWRVAPTPAEFGLWSLIGLVFFIALPPAYIYHEVKAGRITDFHIQLREQRASVFVVFLASTALGIGCYWLLGVPTPLFILSIVVFLSALVAALITLYWKISIHAWVIAGSVATFTLMAADPRWWWGLLAAPLIIWARVHRHRHSIAQGVTGAVAGVGVTALLYQLIAR